MGNDATVPLIDIFKDPLPATRKKIVGLLGERTGEGVRRTCEAALTDGDPGVRWTAVESCKQLGMPMNRISLFLAKRPRGTHSALGAAILNLFFFGLGYHYLGKWWGFSVFMTYTSVMTLVQLYTMIPFPFIYVYPFSAVFAIHTYYTVSRIPDM